MDIAQKKSQLKVVMVAEADFGGSGQRLVDALRDGGVDATMIIGRTSKLGYPYDIKLHGSANRIKKQFAEIARGAHIIHFKGDKLPGAGWSRNFYHHPTAARVFTAGGSGFRRKDGTSNQTQLEWYPIDRYRSRVDLMSALTPDLMYEDDIYLLPHAYPSVDIKPWRSAEAMPIIGHSPSVRNKKGTDTVFLPALDILRSKGYKFDTLIIENVSHEECLRLKRQCDIFFDQAVCDAYGNSAIEAMMMGIPVVTKMSPLSVSRGPTLPILPRRVLSGYRPRGCGSGDREGASHGPRNSKPPNRGVVKRPAFLRSSTQEDALPVRESDRE